MLCLAALLAAAPAVAPAAFSVAAPAAPPVILVTVDGVRARELFRGLDGRLAGPGAADGAPLLPRLAARAAREGLLAGDPARGDPFPVGNPAALSLPGYQSILAGRDLGCRDNRCGRVAAETVLERARRELDLARSQVAVFASWPEVALAVEHEEGALAVDVASPAGAGAAGLPPWGYRGDGATWARAMRYLAARRPRLLYVALGDPDEWGHLGDYPAYAESLRAVDARLEALFRLLGGLGAYGAGASVLVTTDHGRGEGAGWAGHGAGVPGSEAAWLFASTPATRAAPGQDGRGRLDHRSIRPTIEALLGLPPCAACRPPAAALLPPALARGPGPGAGGPDRGAGGP